MSFARVVRTQQPQQAVQIDTNHPLARGLVFAWIPAGDQLVKSGAVGQVVNRLGVGISTNGSSTYEFMNRAPVFDLNECSLTAILTPQNINAASAYAVCAGQNASANPLFMIGNSGTSNQLGFRTRDIANADLEVKGTSADWANGVPSVVTGTRSKTAAVQRVFAAGKQVASSAVGTAAATTFDRFAIGCLLRSSAALHWNGATNLVLIHNRALSDAEIKSLSDNPWQLFSSQARPIFVPVGAAGGSPYTLTADTANLSITGADAGLAYPRTIIAEAAALAINGTATGLAFNRVLTADTANLALTGNAATLTYTPIGGPTYTLPADTANTAIAGTATGLAFNRRLIADTANAPINGAATGLARGYTLAANSGALGISGSDAALIAVRKLITDSYALAVAGADATLTYTPLTLPTIGRPASDTSNTGWTASTGSDLYAMLDEVTPSDTDYISASSVGAVCKMALNSTSYPGTASQVLKYRASSSTGNSVIVRLKEGATTIRAETQVLTSVDTEYSITLTSGEIAAITSGALSVELESA